MRNGGKEILWGKGDSEYEKLRLGSSQVRFQKASGGGVIDRESSPRWEGESTAGTGMQ